jgi:Fe-S cluster assembly iron-binding protein IscA
MIMVTERAKTYLRESVLTKIQAKTPGVSARLAQTEAGTLSVFPDKKMEGDQVVEHQGAVILLIDGALSARLTGATIDCVESPGESHLRIIPPTATEADTVAPASP